MRRLQVLHGGLIAAGLAILITFYAAFTARYGLAEYGDRQRQSIGTLAGFSNEAVYVYVAAMLVVFAAYALGCWLLQHVSHQSAQRSVLLIIVLGSAGFCGVLLPMYPVDASDVYDYIMRGRMSALYGLNPMLNVPEQASTDPFYRYTSWRRTPSAYGPAWEILAHTASGATAHLSRDEQVLVYKGIAVAGYALTGIFIGLTLHRIAPRRWLLGTYLFLWNPLVVYMVAGRGHHDGVMTACVAFAILCLSRRWYVLALLGALLGALVKFIPALLLPLIVLLALRDLGWRRWLGVLLVAGVVGGTLAVLLYIPYWHGWDTVRTSRRAVMFTGSVATVARQWLMPLLDGVTELSTPARQTPVTSAFLANSTLILFGLFYVLELRNVWLARALMPTVRSFGRILLCYLLVASMWFHGWYVIWLVAIIALLEDTPVRRLSLAFSYLVTWQSLLYNTFSISTQRTGLYLPWLDLVPVLIYMGYAYGCVAHYQAGILWQRWLRQPQDIAVGRRLQKSREAAGLSLSELSDELTIRYDVLAQYEQGVRPMSLVHGRRLAQRLDLSLPDWLGSRA